MDASQQLHDLDADGWRRGLYDDIKRTFRAPFVNWIFRTATATQPAFTRYAWGLVKPLFETRAFARLTVEYRDVVLSALDVPRYRRAEADLAPAEYAELRGQLATFDVLAPRLAVLFETMGRALHDGDVGTDPATDRAATAPYPEWLDRDRGRPPSMVDEPPAAAAETADRVRAFHGFDGSLPSVYRCLLQWPEFFGTLWENAEPELESDGFTEVRERTDGLVDEFVVAAPYRPRLDAESLHDVGLDEGTVEDARELFRTFKTGPVETVLPALPVWAASVGSAGDRSL
jgi:hypothetical protein